MVQIRSEFNSTSNFLPLGQQDGGTGIDLAPGRKEDGKSMDLWHGGVGGSGTSLGETKGCVTFKNSHGIIQVGKDLQDHAQLLAKHNHEH